MKEPEQGDLQSNEETLIGPDGAPDHGAVGRYRLLQKLGEGGMGEVWLAEQAEPVRRRVALKVIKPGMDSRQVIARFEMERQALAIMDHPNIAKVLDAGTTDEGRPYFVMDYVRGEPIVAYCDRHRLTIRERLELLMQACDGVQHAHHKAVIHRDLKPSNILVEVVDGRPTPKIIDFGVAKAIAHRMTERTLFTEMGVLIGTPEYMSPEQAEMGATDIDTRTDVYSLGVVLYELLTGKLPFEAKELREGGYDAIRRRIREEEPHKPSTRISTAGDDSAESATRRRVEPRTLVRSLRGDLDQITMKALEKDRTRRYGAPSELAADIHRHLRHEPVLASPPSAAYRVRKFVRRHKAGAAMVGALAIGLAAVAILTAFYLQRIAAERDRANLEASTLNATGEFLVSLFRGVDPDETYARQLLGDARSRLDEPEGDTLARARMAHTVGLIYMEMGLHEDGLPLLERSARIKQEILGDDHRVLVGTLLSLAWGYRVQDRFSEAVVLADRAVSVARSDLGEDQPDYASALYVLGHLRALEGRHAEAEALHREALDIRRSVLGSDHENTLRSISELALLYDEMGQFQRSDPLHAECVERRRKALGRHHPDLLQSLSNRAVSYHRQERFEEARAIFEDILARARSRPGRESPWIRVSLYNLACVAARQGRPDEALAFLREAIDEGFDNVQALTEDDDLASLRSLEEFERLTSSARRAGSPGG